MKQALIQADKAFKSEEIPVGAVVIKEDKVIGRAYNQREQLNDPTAHAEILAIRSACHNLKTQNLSNCTIFVTLEPCSMCASAIQNSRIKRLYFGCNDEQRGAINSGTKIFSQKNCNHKPEIYDGIIEVKSVAREPGSLSLIHI